MPLVSRSRPSGFASSISFSKDSSNAPASSRTELASYRLALTTSTAPPIPGNPEEGLLQEYKKPQSSMGKFRVPAPVPTSDCTRLTRVATERPRARTNLPFDSRRFQADKNSLASGLSLGSCAGTVAGLRGKGHTDTTWKDYAVGDIVRAIHLAPNQDPNARLDDRTVGYNAQTGPSQHKYRPCVVVGIYENSLKCVPIFSSRGNGLQYKSASVRDECIYLRTTQEPGVVTTTPGIPVDHVFARARLTPGSYIYFTQDFPVDYRSPIEYLGYLPEAYADYVVERCRLALEKGLRNVKEHHQWQKAALYDLCQALEQSTTSDSDGCTTPQKRIRLM